MLRPISANNGQSRTAGQHSECVERWDDVELEFDADEYVLIELMKLINNEINLSPTVLFIRTKTIQFFNVIVITILV